MYSGGMEKNDNIVIDEKRPPPGWEVIATHHGFVLRFREARFIRVLGEQLIGQAEAAEEGLLGDPPYLHATFHTGTEAAGWMDEYTDTLKAERQE